MQLEILPLKGVGIVEFDMNREETRSRIGRRFRSFKRSPQSSFPCDYFEDIGLFFHYDSQGHLEAVEFVSPARPTVAGLELLGLIFQEACDNLHSLDREFEREVDGAIAHQIGVSIYAPLAKDDPTATVKTALAFRPGYYK